MSEAKKALLPGMTPAHFNARSPGHLPGWMGVTVDEVSEGLMRAHLAVRPDLFAPNGFLHAGTVITLADTTCGYGTLAHLPEGASGFTTIELKSNHVGTAREGTIEVAARAAHMGRTTQVWDAVVTNQSTGKTMALFRCTQMVLYGK